MIFKRDRASSPIPRWILAVLVGSILASVVVDLVLAALEYRSFEAYYRTTELNASEVLGALSNHLWWAMQQTWFPVGFIILGFVLARRGRRWLFAGPTLAFFVTPVLVAVIGEPQRPRSPASQEGLADWRGNPVSG